jgi:hypothetical protein
MFRLKRKPKKYIILVDCLGAIDDESVPGSNYISSDDRKSAQDENPNRPFENQVGTAYYLNDLFDHLVQHYQSYNILSDGIEIVLMGTNGEVATAKRYLPSSIYETKLLTSPCGTIGTADKWKYARARELDNNTVIVYTDQPNAAVYNSLRLIVGSFIKVVSFVRTTDKTESSFVPWKVLKNVIKYGSKI